MHETTTRKAFGFALIGAVSLTLLIALLDPLLDGVPHPPDQGAWWYYWRLSEPSALTRAAAWIGYALHQLAVWFLGWRLAKQKPGPGRVSRWNLLMLGANGLFILLHILKTHLTYDGLAQDVPVWTSQWSVIIMLVIILYQKAPSRGLILGRKIAWKPEARRLSAMLHGPYIAWALVYTFWFHPAEGDFGLLAGFFYMFLLLTQLSFAGTELHFKARWMVLLEVMVGVHGPAISIQKMLSEKGVLEPGSWIMFLSGFLFMFVFTGQFAFRLKAWARALIFATYAALVLGLYSWWDLGKLYTLVFIPAALYGGALAWALLVGLGGRLIAARAPARAQE